MPWIVISTINWSSSFLEEKYKKHDIKYPFKNDQAAMAEWLRLWTWKMIEILLITLSICYFPFLNPDQILKVFFTFGVWTFSWVAVCMDSLLFIMFTWFSVSLVHLIQWHGKYSRKDFQSTCSYVKTYNFTLCNSTWFLLLAFHSGLLEKLSMVISWVLPSSSGISLWLCGIYSAFSHWMEIFGTTLPSSPFKLYLGHML